MYAFITSEHKQRYMEFIADYGEICDFCELEAWFYIMMVYK